MSVTSSPARRSAASSSGRESGLRPGAPNALAHLGDQRLEPLRPGAARRPRPEQVGEQALVDVDPPRHAGVRHLGRDEGTRRLRREQQPEPGGLGRRRHGGQLPGVLEVGAQVLGRVVDREQRRIGRRARPEPVPVLRLLTLQQPRVHRGRPPQQVVAQPQVVAALDPHPGRQQRRIPPRGVVPHPARRVDLARSHVRRQVGHRHLTLARRRRRPARGRPAGARARPGSWGQPDTGGDAPVQLDLQGSPPLWVSASYSGADHAHTPCSLFATHRKTSNCLPS